MVDVNISKVLISLYTYISILYVFCAYLLNSVLVFVLELNSMLRKFLQRYDQFYYNIFHYFGLCAIYLATVFMTKNYHFFACSFVTPLAVISLTLLFLYVGTFIWNFLRHLLAL